jgi:hypothetical protein
LAILAPAALAPSFRRECTAHDLSCGLAVWVERGWPVAATLHLRTLRAGERLRRHFLWRILRTVGR